MQWVIKMPDPNLLKKLSGWLTFIFVVLSAIGVFTGLWADVVGLGFLSPPVHQVTPTVGVIEIPSPGSASNNRPQNQTSNPTTIPALDNCEANALPARLVIGQMGRVLTDPPLHNLLRYGPSKDSAAFDRIEIGMTFTVLDGPICRENIHWWHVRSYEDVVGWTAEANETRYFVEPLH